MTPAELLPQLQYFRGMLHGTAAILGIGDKTTGQSPEYGHMMALGIIELHEKTAKAREAVIDPALGPWTNARRQMIAELSVVTSYLEGKDAT